MESDMMMALGSGGAMAFVVQFLKGSEWGRWPNFFLAVGAAFLAGFTTNAGGIEHGVQAALAAVTTHSVILHNLPLGKALSQNGLTRVLGLVAQVATTLKESLEKPPTTPPPSR